MGAEFVRSDLATPEAIGEVPQGTLAGVGLIDGPSRTILETRLDEEGGVGTPGHATEHLDLAGAEDFGDLGFGGFRLRRPLMGQFSLGHA